MSNSSRSSLKIKADRFSTIVGLDTKDNKRKSDVNDKIKSVENNPTTMNTRQSDLVSQ